MVIVEDKRQHKGKHELKHQCFREQGVEWVENNLPVGDYALYPKRSVDTKANMSEIAQNIGSADHTRFVNELKRAKQAGCMLYVLVENTDNITDVLDVHLWKNPSAKYRPGCIQGPQLQKAMETIQSRYGCKFIFCKPEDAAQKIIQLLTEEE